MLDQLTRRQVLRSASLAALAAFLPPVLRGVDFARAVSSTRTLILLELEGGNDGLNTIVPFADSRYAAARPSLKLTPSLSAAPADTLEYTKTYVPFVGAGAYTTFTDGATGLVGTPTGLGIHKALMGLQPAWKAHDLAIVQGVGYGNPNRSHFRGIDIWNSAVTDSQAFAASGWLGRMFTGAGVDGSSRTNGMLFRRPNNNPLAQAQLRAVALDNPDDFIEYSENIAQFSAAAPTATGNAALDQVLVARHQAAQARESLVTAMSTEAATQIKATVKTAFPQTKLGKQANDVARCIAGGLNCAFYKISIGGFDNHTEQKTKHADLLGDVGASLAALRLALIAAGKWNDVLIMTYSEFGRRVEENGSRGTDHGTAAPHFFMGGQVNGGIYGTHPSLTTLDDSGDMLYNTDFRRLYATCGSWLGVTAPQVNTALTRDSGADYTPLSVI